jgi:hypothetical protein
MIRSENDRNKGNRITMYRYDAGAPLRRRARFCSPQVKLTVPARQLTTRAGDGVIRPTKRVSMEEVWPS